MSRMWPSYIPYTFPSPTKLDKKYRLFLYREAYPGRPIDSDEPRGRPALFIPGNAGSFGQVRSVASSAHHLFESGQGLGGSSLPVDWWTIDFNEDFSAFHGQTMHEQAVFVNEAVAHLLKRYPSARQVPILAHSMGGIVARLMLLKKNHPKDSVDIIITLSSPHAYPPVPLDSGVERVYEEINSRWKEHAQKVLLISLSGGLLDIQLSSEPASLSLARVWHDNTSLSAFTSSLPALWSGVDHLAMLWCDQLRERLARGVLRIEGQGKTIIERRREWARMLGAAAASTKLRDALSMEESTLSKDSSEATNSHISIFSVDDADAVKHQGFDLITSLAVGLDLSFGPPIEQDAQLRVDLCRKDEDGGLVCRHVLPSAYDLLPPAFSVKEEQYSDHYNRFPDAEERYEVPGKGLRRLRLSIALLNQGNIDTIRIEKWQVPRNTILEAAWTDRPLQVRSPSIANTRTVHMMADSTVRTSTPIREVILADMDSSLLAYRVKVASPKSLDTSAIPDCDKHVQPLLLIESLSTGDSQWYSPIRPGTQLTFALHASSPFMPPASQAHRGTKMTLVLDTCGQIGLMQLFISIDWPASAGLLLSRYRSAIAALPLVFLLLITAAIWREWDEGASFPSLSSASVQYAPYLVTITIIGCVLLLILQSIISGLVASDGMMSHSLQNLAFGLPSSPLTMSVVLAFIFLTSSYGLTLLAAISLEAVVASLAFISGASRIRFTSKREEGKSHFQTTFGICSIVGFMVWFFIPVQFVFLVLFVMQLLATVRSKNAARYPNSEAQSQNRLNQCLLVLNVYFWLLPFNAPALLIWARNLVRGYFGILGGSDHNFLYILGFIGLGLLTSGGGVISRPQRRWMSTTTHGLLIGSALYGLAYGIRYSYSLSHSVNIIMSWLVIVHVASAQRSKADDETFTSSSDGSNVESSALNAVGDLQSQVPAEVEKTATMLPESLRDSLLENGVGYNLKGTEFNEASHNGDSKPNELSLRDSLLERYLELLDEYLERKHQIADQLSNGHFHMSKAKMQLGRLTSLNNSWDARMQATSTIRLSPSGFAVLERHNTMPASRRAMEEEGGSLIPSAIAEASTLRRRKGEKNGIAADKVRHGDVNEEEKTKDKKTNKKVQQPFDALYQFSALPPPSLRRAQQDFSSLLEQIIGEQGSRGLLQISAELNELEQSIAAIPIET